MGQNPVFLSLPILKYHFKCLELRMICLKQFAKTGATKLVSIVEFYFMKENERKTNI